jgi:hypothetical protein
MAHVHIQHEPQVSDAEGCVKKLPGPDVIELRNKRHVKSTMMYYSSRKFSECSHVTIAVPTKYSSYIARLQQANRCCIMCYYRTMAHEARVSLK